MKRFIWTEKAEKRAKELGLEERKAKTVAMFGLKPLQDGPIAMVWEKHGFVIEVKEVTTWTITIFHTMIILDIV